MKHRFIENVEGALDDDLLNDLVYWVRVGRNENGLTGDERTYFKKLSKEIRERRLLHVSL